MPLHPRVLVVDADRTRARSLVELLAPAGHDVHAMQPTESRSDAEVVVLSLDIMDADAVARVASATPEAEMLVLVGAGSRVAAMAALRMGAREIVERQAGSDVLLFAVERAARAHSDRRELAALRARIGDHAREALVGQSPGIMRVRELVGRAAASRRTVLVTGEAGAGKSTVARLVHDLSDRAAMPFVVARCEGEDDAGLGVELFGNDNNGLLEHARGGTLVLDEAHAMSAALYSRLTSTLATPGLRAGVDARTMDVRLVLTVRTTPADSPGAMAPFVDERAMLRIPVPALRERRRDIPLLVQHFRDRLTHEGGLAPITGDAMTPLLAHDWPGNVRELSHWVDRTALAADGAHSVPSHFALASAPEFAPLDAAGLTLAALEQRYILHVLAQERGHQSRAADRLGIDRRTLYRKLKGYRDEGIARIAG